MTWCIFFLLATSVFTFTEYRNTGPSLVRWERKRSLWRTCCATKVFFFKYQINNWTIGQLDDWTIGQLSWRWSCHYWGQAGYSRQVSVWPISVFFLIHFEIKVKSFPENLKNNRVGQVLAEEKPHWPEDCKREYHAMTRGFHPVLLTNWRNHP